jgi:CDP-paratose 2-epimerase
VRILVTGACGFVGSTLLRTWSEARRDVSLIGIDSLVRPGSETNRDTLRRLGVKLIHADLRSASDCEMLPGADVVIDAAAQPSVLAGVDGRTSSRQLVEHNLFGTVNLLEFCRRESAAFVLLSTSRVYSISALNDLPLRVAGDAFEPDPSRTWPSGVSAQGIDDGFSTAAPVSLYGATKLASEQLALEYGAAFGFPVWINRCGVLAGAGQFARPDQGIFSFWIHCWLAGRPLSYIGFDGAGHQVRDCLHPADLVPLIDQQLRDGSGARRRLVNLSGGRASAMSLRQLSRWCEEHIGPHHVGSDPKPRAFDLPWVVLDSRLAADCWGWTPRRTVGDILTEILTHARAHRGWLDVSAG